MAKTPDTRWRIVEGTLKLAAEKPWRDVSIADIATKVRMKPANLLKVFPGRTAILGGLSAYVDGKMLSAMSGTATDDESVRDRLFEALMARFDALQSHRTGIQSIIRDTVPADPVATLCGAAHLMRSMRLALAVSGIHSWGPRSMLMAKGLAIVYLTTARVWLTDESEDLSPTMAALDKNLRRAGQIAGMLSGRRPGKPGAEEA